MKKRSAQGAGPPDDPRAYKFRGEDDFKTILEKLVNGVLVVSREGTIAYANKSAGILFGRDDKGLINEKFGLPLRADRIVEINIQRLNQDVGTAEMHVDDITWQGRPSRLVFLHDVTARKQWEAGLRQAKEEAEASSRSKSEFLAGMSHELRTPLNAIIGFSEMLEDQYVGPLNEKQAKYINDILKSGKHLLGLIDDILDLSKVEAEKMPFEAGPVNIGGLLADSLRIIAPECGKHDITVDLRTGGLPSDLEIIGDRQKLKQILYNLLSNAVKFTPDGGSVRVSARMISDSKIEISVADSGIGIAPDIQNKIFSAFYQARSGFSGKSQGTGLGLALTKKMVEIHGGHIRFKSRGTGLGSCFIVTLPLGAVPAGKDDRELTKRQPALPPGGFLSHLNRAVNFSRRHKRAFTLVHLAMRPEMPEGIIAMAEQALKAQKRDFDYLGRDEAGHVVLILLETGRQNTQKAVTRLTAHFKKLTGGRDLQFDLAVYPEDGKTAEALIEKLLPFREK